MTHSTAPRVAPIERDDVEQADGQGQRQGVGHAEDRHRGKRADAGEQADRAGCRARSRPPSAACAVRRYRCARRGLPSESTSALQPRGPSISSMMVIVTMVTAAATIAGRLREDRGDRARPRNQVVHTARRDRADASLDVEVPLEDRQRSARLEQVVSQMRQAAESWRDWLTRGTATAAVDGDDDRDRGQRDQGRAEPARHAVPLEPGHRRCDRHGEHDRDEQPDEDPAQIPDQDEEQRAARDDRDDNGRPPCYLREAKTPASILIGSHRSEVPPLQTG